MYWDIGLCRILLLCTYQNLSEVKYGIVDTLPVTVSAEVDAKLVARWVFEFFPLYDDFCFHAGWTCDARCGTHCLTEGGSVARTRCACVRALTPRLCDAAPERCSLRWRGLGVKRALCDVWPSVLPGQAGAQCFEGALPAGPRPQNSKPGEMTNCLSFNEKIPCRNLSSVLA